jgi:hypothetical protein
MIQINATTHTKGGLTIPTGAVLDVTAIPSSKRVATESGFEVQYGLYYSVEIFKSLAGYEANDLPIGTEHIEEYDRKYFASDVDLLSLDVTGVLNILKDYIENGGGDYPGVGTGNCAIVYPFT